MNPGTGGKEAWGLSYSRGGVGGGGAGAQAEAQRLPLGPRPRQGPGQACSPPEPASPSRQPRVVSLWPFVQLPPASGPPAGWL